MPRPLANLALFSAISLSCSAMAAGCRNRTSVGDSSDPVGYVDGGTIAHAPTPMARARLADALRVAHVDARWVSALKPGHSGATHVFHATDGAIETSGLTDARNGVSGAFGGSAPLFADGTIEAHVGETMVSLRVHDSRTVEGSLIDGDVVFPDVHASTDLFVAAAPGRVESFWLLRDANAPSTFTMTLGLLGLEARVGSDDNDAIRFVDAAGVVRLRLPTPTAVDANGTRRAASMHLEGTTLTITLDREGLVFPILLDPALEQVTWADVGLEPPSWPPPGTTYYPRIGAPAGLQRVSGRAQSGNGLVYLFGGTTIAGSPTTQVTPYVTALFEWNGTTWSASPGGDFGGMLTFGDPDKGTVNRVTDIVWDPARKKLVMFGGIVFGPMEPRMGVSEYDPVAKSWSDVCGAGSTCYDSAPPVGVTPSGAYAFGKVILVHPAGTWVWNGSTQLFSKLGATPELMREATALAFDEARSRLVVYGDKTGLSDTWETDGTTWTHPSTTGPLGVANASLTYHKARKRVVLWASSSSTDGLWEWNGTTWAAVVVDGAGPPARPNAAFAYHEATGKLLVVGGGDLGGGSTSSCYDSPYSNPYDNNRDFRSCARVDTWTSTVFGGACTVAADCAAGTFCVDGVCCKTACTGACQNCAQTGSIGKCSAVVSADDPGTCSGTASCDASGSCRKKQGQVCSIGTDCLSGNCADGYCCDTSCGASCEACNLAGKLGACTPLAVGSTGKSCGLYSCSGTTGACLASCTSDANCAPSAYCNAAGKCVAPQVKGATCTRNRQCDTSVCVDGVCCGSACAGVCDVCSAALGASTDGTCTVLAKTASPAACGPSRCSGVTAACGTTCTTDGDCSTAGFCNGGVCALVRKQGESCARTAECTSGLTCADGVCCNATCNGACQACSALNKQSGDKSGECGPAAEGTNPGAKCLKSAVTTCGSSGTCDAAGSCAVYVAGTACGATGTTSCVGDSVKGQTCDGLGACILDTAGTPCSPARCVDGACKTSCITDTDCATDGYCTGGVCKKRATAGDKCSLDTQCLSGFCADGTCCNARCDRSCEACDQPGTKGTCTAVTGKPRLGHPACAAGEPGNPCSAAACDGAERASCAKKAGAEVTCSAGTCIDGVESLPTTCDGSGTCPAAASRPCQPFACGTDACKKACAADSDCKAGFVCNTATGSCTAGDKCAVSLVTHVDGTTTDCGAYICESSGKCKTTCASSSDCVSPKICDGTACVDPPDGAVDQGGGCATSSTGGTSGNRDTSGTWPILVLSALVGLIGRRKR